MPGLPVNQVYTVGRAKDNTVVLENAEVSRYHLKITEVPGGLIVEDLGSRNGTYFNGRRVTRLTLQPHDVLYLGNTRFSLSCLKTSSLFAPRLTTVIGPQVRTLTIGRSRTNDIVLPLPQVSAMHARLTWAANQWIIEDLKSTNGTYVNGVAVNQKRLSVGDHVAIASYDWNWEEDLKQLENIRFRTGLGIEATKVSVIRDERVILDKISLLVNPGELLAIVGPSGSGKTTLMNVLRGVISPEAGRVLVDGKDLLTHMGGLLGQVGYVPQDDIIHRELNVFESLYYSSKLRLPSDTSEEELVSRVNLVLSDLGLLAVKSSRIGTPERRGISGGERKRVNVGQELVTEPPVLFLDEPTSGLDPQSNIEVMRIFRGLSDKGKTVILSTHNISNEVFETLNLVAVLSEGRLVYYGTPAKALVFFGVSQPAEIFSRLKDSTADGLKERFEASPFYREFVEGRAGRTNRQRYIHSVQSGVSRASLFRQVSVLVARYARRKLRDEMNLAVLFLQAPVIGLLIGLVLREDKTRTNVLFLMVIAAIWFGCLSAAREVVAEKGVYLRERMGNLKIPSYLISKFIVLGGMSALQCLLLIGTVSAFVSLPGSIETIFLVLLLSAFGGIALGLCISSLVHTGEAAIAMTPLVLIPQIVLGGVIRPVSAMGESVEFLAGIMLSRWGSEALIGLSEPDVLKPLFGISQPQTVTDMIMLFQLGLIFFFVAGLCLRRLDPF